MTKTSFGSQFRILLGSDIELAVDSNYLYISPFQRNRTQPSSYDISIANILNYSSDIDNDIDLLHGEKIDFTSVELSPSQSILFVSEEIFQFPNDMFAEIFLRSRYARQLNTGGNLGRIECGWKGRLILELSNQSLARTVKLEKGAVIATLVIYQIDSPNAYSHSGLFQNWV